MAGNFPSRYGRPRADGSLSEALIDRRINPHGLILAISKQITPRISGYVYGGVSYELAN